jgi:hypothetical protein
MNTFKQFREIILKEFAKNDDDGDGNGDHGHGYTLGSMTHLYLHNIEGEKTGHKGFITTSEGHAVSVHHNTSDQEHGDSFAQAPSDDMDEPVQGHTTVHSVLRNGTHVGNLYVSHDDYGGKYLSYLGNKEGKHPRMTADMRPSLSSMEQYTKHWSYKNQMSNIDPKNKNQLGKLVTAHRSMAEDNFNTLLKKLK